MFLVLSQTFTKFSMRVTKNEWESYESFGNINLLKLIALCFWQAVSFEILMVNLKNKFDDKYNKGQSTS